MIQELKDMIDYADSMNQQKAKKILLKIAELKEENQSSALQLVRLVLKVNS